MILRYEILMSERSLKSIVQSLADRGFCIAPAFLDGEITAALRDDFDRLLREEKFKAAKVGQADAGKAASGVRTDRIFWFAEKETVGARAAVSEKLEELRSLLNRDLFLGIQDFETHYAFYEAGGYYRRHRDVFKKDDRRLISFVLYLNENWKPADGGRLILHPRDSELTAPVQVDPTAGTGVFFLSDVEHEVDESHARRKSCTGWFRRAPRTPNE
jgi:SM-20-related protein